MTANIRTIDNTPKFLPEDDIVTYIRSQLTDSIKSIDIEEDKINEYLETILSKINFSDSNDTVISQVPPKFHLILASKLMELGKEDYILKNLDKFSVFSKTGYNKWVKKLQNTKVDKEVFLH